MQVKHDSAPPLAAKENPPPPDDKTGAFLTGFVGTQLETVIAKYYYSREWDVYNIQIPAGVDYFPWFAHVSKQDQFGNIGWKPIGYVSSAVEGAVARRKAVAETFEGGEKGELWVLTLIPTTVAHPVYEAVLHELRPAGSSPRWVVKDKQRFEVR